jgi:hypothetical protein
MKTPPQRCKVHLIKNLNNKGGLLDLTRKWIVTHVLIFFWAAGVGVGTASRFLLSSVESFAFSSNLFIIVTLLLFCVSSATYNVSPGVPYCREHNTLEIIYTKIIKPIRRPNATNILWSLHNICNSSNEIFKFNETAHKNTKWSEHRIALTN